MKRTRKGFTLVELLIVVAILATLTAAMTASVSGSTAKAKAATIANNVEAFVNAARLYCADNTDAIDNADTDTVISAYIGKWGDLENGTSVKYEADDIAQPTGDNAVAIPQPKTWCVKVTIPDSDHANIIAELEKIPGFGKYSGTDSVVKNANSTGFFIRLWNGSITATKPTE